MDAFADVTCGTEVMFDLEVDEICWAYFNCIKLLFPRLFNTGGCIYRHFVNLKV